MTTVSATLADLEHEISDALADLRCARRDDERRPSPDTEITVHYAERRLNRLIERRAGLTHRADAEG